MGVEGYNWVDVVFDELMGGQTSIYSVVRRTSFSPKPLEGRGI